MTSCRFSRWRISAILDFRGAIMGSLKSPCTTSYRSSIETKALKCLVFLNCVFFVFWQQTDRQINRPITWSRSRCRERRLNNINFMYQCTRRQLSEITSEHSKNAYFHQCQVHLTHETTRTSICDILHSSNLQETFQGPGLRRANLVKICQNKKLGCRREAEQCFVSLNISLCHSRWLKVIRNYDTFESHCSYVSILYRLSDIKRQMAWPWNLG